MYKFSIAGVLLPIAPQSLSIEVDDKDVDIDLANGGTMTVLNPPGLTTYSFTFRAPNKKYPFALYRQGYIEAPAFLSMLDNLKKSQKPFYFEVHRGAEFVDHRDIKALVSLSSYSVDEDAENGGDYMIDVKLKVYVPTTTVKGHFGKDDTFIIDTTTEREINENIIPYDISAAYYTIQANDTFPLIAKRMFGESSYAEAIAIHNSMDFTIGSLIELEGTIISMNHKVITDIAEKLDKERKAKQEAEIKQKAEELVEEVTLSE